MVDQNDQVKDAGSLEGENVGSVLHRDNHISEPKGVAEGEVKISEEVILQLASQALQSVEGVRPAGGSGLSSFGLGRKGKTIGGVRVTVDDGVPPTIMADTYISIKYGLRIPDVAWDVQEAVKVHLEKLTGYRVECVNVFVQGIHLHENPEKTEELLDEKVEPLQQDNDTLSTEEALEENQK